MINFYDQHDWHNSLSDQHISWLNDVAEEEQRQITELDYVFCSDEYLLKLNVDFLNHNTYTDIITFDYSQGEQLTGEIYISTDRVAENARKFQVTFNNELHRVMVHGVLHLCGYKDKSEGEAQTMRAKEDYYLAKFSSK